MLEKRGGGQHDIGMVGGIGLHRSSTTVNRSAPQAEHGILIGRDGRRI
jgi:hypothetical protein